MPEIPNVVPGEPVESDWGNDIRDRVTQRFADATERTAQLPFPGTGQLSWLDDPGVVDYFDGAVWISLADDPALAAGLALKVAKAGDTMTGLLTVPSLVANTRLQGPLEVFSDTLAGVLPVFDSEQTVDTFTTPRQGTWLIMVVAQGNYASLTDADLFTLRIKEGGNQWAIAQTNMFRTWGSPGVTTGAFSITLQLKTLLFASGSDFDITAQRFGNTGGSNLTSMNWSAFQVEDM